ncbi:MAG: 50S ribosome-binding GTPase [Candidatus Heimdallarchaeota archaeon]|nr:50S ribosome-binding GTPase [Candidatus Heimdallarchaeota archaeon]
MARKLNVTLLGNTLTGKTTLLKRINKEFGDDEELAIETLPTTDIITEEITLKLLSQKNASRIGLERWRNYKLVAVDNPGDFRLRRRWRQAMREFKTEGILFMVDPTQDVNVTRTAMEDAYNYFLDSLDLNPSKADKKAKKKKAIFSIVVNKMDLIGYSKDKAKAYLKNFDEVIAAYKAAFPLGEVEYNFISVINSPYSQIDAVLEGIKQYLYE